MSNEQSAREDEFKVEAHEAIHARNAGLLALGKQPEGFAEVEDDVVTFFVAVVREIRYFDAAARRDEVGIHDEVVRNLNKANHELVAARARDRKALAEGAARESQLEKQVVDLTRRAARLAERIASLKKSAKKSRSS